jgi:MFS family permease
MIPNLARSSTPVSSATPWYRTVTAAQWRVLAAAKLGWMLDAMDFMLYAMAVGQLRAYFSMNDATAGLLGSVTLAMSAVGGIIFGVIADRVGRTRALMATVLIFSLASIGAASSQSIWQLLAWRAVLGDRHGR